MIIVERGVSANQHSHLGCCSQLQVHHVICCEVFNHLHTAGRWRLVLVDALLAAQDVAFNQQPDKGADGMYTDDELRACT